MSIGSWLMNLIDSSGAQRQQELDAANAAQQQQITKANPNLPAPAAQRGTALPRTSPAIGTGTTYSAAVTPEGRVHTRSTTTAKESWSPLGGGFAGTVLAQKKYEDRAAAPTESPTIGEAFGVVPKRSLASQIVGGLARGIAPVVAGGLMGGKKGALQAWGQSTQQHEAERLQQERALTAVEADPKMREAYEVARMNYESDKSMGNNLDMPFGDYLAQALEAIGTKYSGALGTLIDIYGPEAGYAKYESLKQRRGGGGGGGAGMVTLVEFDPVTGVKRTWKVPQSSVPGLGQGVGPSSTTVGPQGTTVRTNVRPSATDYLKR